MRFHLPHPDGTATRVLSGALHTSLLARGIDYALTPAAAFRNVTEWASPQLLGWVFICIAIIGLVGVILHHPAITALSHVAAGAIFLVMGVAGLGPIALTAGWAWRAPVTYIIGNGAVQFYAANASYDRWLKRRGRSPNLD